MPENYGDPTDPRNAYYSNDPEHYVYVNGRWQYRNSKASGEAPAPGPNKVTATQKPLDPVEMAAMVGDWVTTGDPFRGRHVLNTLDTGPGSRIDFAQSEEDAARLGPLISQLQEQAQAGSGAWEGALKQAADKSKANAMALGQSSQSGMGYADKLGAIGNAQASADQRAAGQDNILRAKQQQDAAQQVGQALGQQGGLEANQAASQSAARQGVREAKEASKLERRKMAYNVLGGGAQAAGAIAGMFSDGGPVPGRSKVFGDDEVNDTVPALLSPGEIVLPRSVTMAGDAEAKAADFVRATQASNRVHRFDDGGSVPNTESYEDWIANHGAGRGNQSFGDPAEIEKGNRTAYENRNTPPPITIPALSPDGGPTNLGAAGNPEDGPKGLFADGAENPTFDNGGMLDTARYDANRAANLQNANFLEAMAAGRGPSVAPQMTQNASDEALLTALQQQSAGKGGANSLINSVAQQAQSGAQAASQAGLEQHQGSQALMNSLLQQRTRDIGIAQAQQQAQWRNTMMNAGIGAANQAAIRSILGGAGAAAMGVADMIGKGGDKESAFESSSGGDPFDYGDPIREGDGSGGPASKSTSDDVGDWNTGSIDEGFAAHGGQITEDKRTRDFLASLRRAP